MKQFLIVLFISSLFIFLNSCSDNSTNNNDGGSGSTESYTTTNVKTEGTQYFSFESKSATTEKPAAFDLELTLEQRMAEVGVNSCVYFNVSADPIIKSGPGVTIARIDAASLNDVTAVPADENFSADDTVSAPLIGKTWMDAGHNVKPDVYVFKTCSGNYGLLAIESYEMDFTLFQIKSIKWNFKYNADGSTDFSNATADSFRTENAYEQPRYFSFVDGALAMAYGTWDVTVDGSTIWLGPNVQVYKLENMALNNVTTISETGFNGDDLVSFVCSGWYDSDENHTVIPRDYVYVAKTSSGDVAAFEITNYYDNMGNSGAFTIEWKMFE